MNEVKENTIMAEIMRAILMEDLEKFESLIMYVLSVASQDETRE